MVAQTENLPYADQIIDLDPNVRDAWGLPAPRLTYDWRRPNERARVEFMQKKMEEIGRAMGASHGLARAGRPRGAPGAHHEGGTRMGSDPKTSVVNRYGQSWDIPNLFVVGSSTFPTHERIQSDAHDPGARLHERRRDRQSLQEEPGIAAVAPTTSRIRVLPRVRTFGKARVGRSDSRESAGPMGDRKPWQRKKPMLSSSA